MTDSPNSTAQQRETLLAHWVAQQRGLTNDAIHLKSIASDAGFRRYFRFANPSQWLAVDAPPQTEDSRQFVALALYLSQHGISTPKIQAADEAQGLLLVEDFGDHLLFNAHTTEGIDAYYQQAIDTLIQLQQCPDNPALIPRYDQALLHRELGIFTEWFVGKLLNYALNEQELALIEQVFVHLESSALAQPQCLVHRDYHSRNLIIQQNGHIGIIDFQGALWGAASYDVVSLLRDCYRRWPAEKVNQWALNYHQKATAIGIIPNNSASQFLQGFDWMGLQRHIKVLGIFARLHLRDNKPHYLHDLPLVIRYTLEVAAQYAELSEFAHWFTYKLLPLAEQQSWYSDYRSAGDTQ